MSTTKTWKVYGGDTFAREDYLIGEFLTEVEAQTKAEQVRQELRQTQSEDLRDTIWVQAPSSEEKK
jgi:hypothetical protein